MPLLVLDTSMLLDLELGGFLQAAFRLDLAFVIPDLSFANELADPVLGGYLQQLGLQVTEITSSEMSAATSRQKVVTCLSIYECCALECARRPGCELATDGKELRSQAASCGVECSGLVLLLRALQSEGLVAPQVLMQGLLRLGKLRPARLQDDETQQLLAVLATNALSVGMER